MEKILIDTKFLSMKVGTTVVDTLRQIDVIGISRTQGSGEQSRAGFIPGHFHIIDVALYSKTLKKPVSPSTPMI